MDGELARSLYEHGGFFVFLNVPSGTEFGIDMKSWNTGEKFRGVKMIPPGLHYIFYSSVGSSGDVSPRTGFFHSFSQGEVLVRRWDSNLECMVSEGIDPGEVAGIKENIRRLDGFLGPYPYDIYNKWVKLVSNISCELVAQLQPSCGQIFSALELMNCSDADRPRGSSSCDEIQRKRNKTEDDFLPELKPKKGTELRITSLPEKNYPEGASPSQITHHSMDSSYKLDCLIEKYSQPIDLIGEMEFCYVCFLVGHSLEAFDQWKKIVSLLCSCDKALESHTKIYSFFLTTLEAQLKEVPEDFLADIVSNSNFVYVMLRQFFRNVQLASVTNELKTKVERFRLGLTDKFSWDFTELDLEDDEDLPVIVEDFPQEAIS